MKLTFLFLIALVWPTSLADSVLYSSSPFLTSMYNNHIDATSSLHQQPEKRHNHHGQGHQSGGASAYGYSASEGDYSGGHGGGYGPSGGHGHGGYIAVPVPDHHGGANAGDVALGFLGFLLLLSVLQNSLNNLSMMNTATTMATTTAGAGGRKRREAVPEVSQPGTLESISRIVVPLMAHYAESKDEDQHFHCIQRTMCLANRQLVNELGSTGRVLGHFVSDIVAKSLDADSPTRSAMAIAAGSSGRKGADCETLFYGCDMEYKKHTTGTPSPIKTRSVSPNKNI